MRRPECRGKREVGNSHVFLFPVNYYNNNAEFGSSGSNETINVIA